MRPVLNVEDTRRLEDMIEQAGTSKAELMEAAGEALADAVRGLATSRVVVLAG